jgi:hypothetical protein
MEDITALRNFRKKTSLPKIRIARRRAAFPMTRRSSESRYNSNTRSVTARGFPKGTRKPASPSITTLATPPTRSRLRDARLPLLPARFGRKPPVRGTELRQRLLALSLPSNPSRNRQTAPSPAFVLGLAAPSIPSHARTLSGPISGQAQLSKLIPGPRLTDQPTFTP